MWTNIAGATVVGDANVWTAQLGAGTLISGAGRLFAPYYVMNIFAIPAMIWGMYSIGTSKEQRAKVQKIMYCRYTHFHDIWHNDTTTNYDVYG